MRHITLIACMLLLAKTVAAHGGMQISTPQHDWSIGPGIGYANFEGDHGFALNLDTSYTFFLFNASLNLKLMHEEGLTLFVPQVELCGWFLLNWGGGAGYAFGDLEGPVLHVFAGLPIGDDCFKFGPFKSEFIEPYYRLNFLYTGGEWLLMHEVGLLFKLTTFTI